ncbi:undecaprenyl-diphosphatase, partial [Candidatus Saccharibacteria bacterium]|nr:undecaprenyl-diphosphatase [Candidatus Saccharibacteria bacterium]
FSFYLGIPILLLAGLFKIATGDVASVQGGYLSVVVGIIASFVTAFFVVGWLLRYVSKHDFRAFAYYRIVLGIIVLVLISVGALA